MAMYDHCKSAVSKNVSLGDTFSFKVWVHQGSVLSLCCSSSSWKPSPRASEPGCDGNCINADDLVRMAESLQDLGTQHTAWKNGKEWKGLRVNVKKTMIWYCRAFNWELI